MLVFDEVMTGFRLAYGGAQERYGVTPDLTVLGKIIGGGLPAAAYGASAGVMDFVSPAGPIYQAGTLSGNPLAMAAGLATLRLLRDEPPYDRLEALSARLAEGLDRAATDAGVPHVVQRVGSMLTLFFNAEPGPQLRGRQAVRHRTFRPVLLGDARPRRVPALQPVRGRLRLRRPHRGRHRPHDRRRRRVAEGDRGVTAAAFRRSASSAEPADNQDDRAADTQQGHRARLGDGVDRPEEAVLLAVGPGGEIQRRATPRRTVVPDGQRP